MSAKPLTKAEKAWLVKLQKVFDECPSSRLAAYATGDNELNIYDSGFDLAVRDLQDEKGLEFGAACDELEANLHRIKTTFAVSATCA